MNHSNTDIIPIEQEEKLPHLRLRVRKFCEFVLEGKTKKDARILAGYRDRNDHTAEQQAYTLLNKNEVKRYLEIRERQIFQAMAERTNVATERIILELMRLAFMDPRNLYNPDGSLKEIKDLPADLAACVSSVEVEELFAGRGDKRTNYGKLKKIRFWSKSDAITTLAKIKGMLIDNVKITQPLSFPEIAKMSREHRAKVVKQLDEVLAGANN